MAIRNLRIEGNSVSASSREKDCTLRMIYCIGERPQVNLHENDFWATLVHEMGDRMSFSIVDVLCAVPGWLKENEALMLYELARDWPGDGSVVELGSYQGRSTICLAAGVRARSDTSRPIVSVDIHTGSLEHQPGGLVFNPNTLDSRTGRVNTSALFFSNIQKFGVADMVEARIATTQEAARAFIGEVRLLFVDADHTEKAVQDDVDAWSRHFQQSACLILHDVGRSWPGPTAVAQRLLASGNYSVIRRAGSALALNAKGAVLPGLLY